MTQFDMVTKFQKHSIGAHCNAPLRWYFLFPAILLTLILSGCAGLAGEPRIISTAALPTITPTSPSDTGKPPAKVSLLRGAEIFGGEQGCQACHGITGEGNGPTAASLSCTVPDFTDPAGARSETISVWFAITTNGNNSTSGCLMPPWKGRLDEQQRWDVTSYAYSLHYTNDQLVFGETVYQEKCAVCHGANATGQANVPNIAEPGYLIDKSDTDLWQLLTNGLPDGSHKFDDVTDEGRWAVVAYIRSLTWERDTGTAEPDASDTVVQTATSTATAVPVDTANITISGKITNRTPDAAPLPAGTTVTLRVIELSEGSSPRDVQTLEAKTTEDGAFTFGEQPRQINMVYIATVNYGGVLQTSTPVRLAQGAGAVLDLSFDIYDVTNDNAAVQADQMGLFVSPFSANTVLVQQGLSFTNTSGKMLMSERGSVAVTLPPNATQVQIAERFERAFTVDQGNIVRGLQPLYPGAEKAQALQVSYLLPYENTVQFPLSTTYPIQKLTVYIPQISGFTVEGGQFIPGETLTLQDGVYNTFNYQGAIPAGQAFQLVIRTTDPASDRRNVLAVVLFIAGLVLFATIVAVWWLNRGTTRSRAPSDADSIIQAIADLDTRFERGKIDRETYETERERLKVEAAKSMRS